MAEGFTSACLCSNQPKGVLKPIQSKAKVSPNQDRPKLKPKSTRTWSNVGPKSAQSRRTSQMSIWIHFLPKGSKQHLQGPDGPGGSPHSYRPKQDSLVACLAGTALLNVSVVAVLTPSRCSTCLGCECMLVAWLYANNIKVERIHRALLEQIGVRASYEP